MYRKKRLCLQGAKKRADDRNYTETLSLDDLSSTLSEKNLNVPELRYELMPAFCPLVIRLEFVENRERFAAFVWGKIIMSAILTDAKNESLQARILFADALYCVTGHMITSAVLVVLIRHLVM